MAFPWQRSGLCSSLLGRRAHLATASRSHSRDPCRVQERPPANPDRAHRSGSGGEAGRMVLVGIMPVQSRAGRAAGGLPRTRTCSANRRRMEPRRRSGVAGTVGMSISSGGTSWSGGISRTRLPARTPTASPRRRTPGARLPECAQRHQPVQRRYLTAPSPTFPLPARVDAIAPDLIGSTSYSADPADATYDIAYDLWLNDCSTRTPCRTSGTIEVMVWTAYDDRAFAYKPEDRNRELTLCDRRDGSFR